MLEEEEWKPPKIGQTDWRAAECEEGGVRRFSAKWGVWVVARPGAPKEAPPVLSKDPRSYRTADLEAAKFTPPARPAAIPARGPTTASGRPGTQVGASQPTHLPAFNHPTRCSAASILIQKMGGRVVAIRRSRVQASVAQVKHWLQGKGLPPTAFVEWVEMTTGFNISPDPLAHATNKTNLFTCDTYRVA